MLGSMLRDRVEIQEKSVTQVALGQAVSWASVGTYYARRIPLDVRAIAQYQQLNTVVTDRFIFRGDQTIEVGVHRLVQGSRTWEPQASAKWHDGVTEVVAVEV